MDPDWTWDEMLEEFHALGGVAENIRLGRGRLGRGLFPLNQTLPVLLRVPPNLLFPVDDVEFLGDRMRIRKSANIARRERDFFERYECAFSWGGGGQSESTAYIEKLDALPSDVRALLISNFQFGDLLEGDFVGRTNKQFLKSRQIKSNEKLVVMPLIELANHDPNGLPYKGEECLQIDGRVRDEVLVSYGPHDSFSMFQIFGFVSQEPATFSVPMKLKVKTMELTVGRDFSQAAKRGNFWSPRLNSSENTLALSFLMIGNPEFSRLLRGAFCTLIEEAGIKDADEVFDRILHFNWMKFLKLLEALEPHRGEMIVNLRKMAHFQLDKMAYCTGGRELEPPAST